MDSDNSGSFVDKEPVVLATTILSAITIGVAFGAPISPDQKMVIQAELPVILGGLWLTAAWVRSHVFSPHTVETEVKPAAFVTGAAASESGAVRVDTTSAGAVDAVSTLTGHIVATKQTP